MPKVHENTLSRKSAVQVLYAGALRGANAALLLKNGEIVCMDQPVNDYAVFLVEGVEKHKEELDRQLAGVSENWTLDRMPVLDLAILRLALFEMLYSENVPVSVSINEAVELAKEFGGEDDSPKFVNGVLGRLARQLEGVTDAELAEVEATCAAIEAEEAAAADAAEAAGENTEATN